MNEIRRIDIAEFRQLGFVQEINRRLLHPLGLALEVLVNEDGTEQLGGVWDYRDDPEGIYFGAGEIDAAKAAALDAEWQARREARVERLGYMVQPTEIGR